MCKFWIILTRQSHRRRFSQSRPGGWNHLSTANTVEVRLRERDVEGEEEGRWAEEGKEETQDGDRRVAGPPGPALFPGHTLTPRRALLPGACQSPSASARISAERRDTAQVSETNTRWSQAEPGGVGPRGNAKAEQEVLAAEVCVCLLPSGKDLINHCPDIIKRVSDAGPVVLFCRAKLSLSER